MTTKYTGRSIPSASPATGRTNLDDLWAGLDYDLALMTDEDDNVIIFHTWLYGDSQTFYTGRILP